MVSLDGVPVYHVQGILPLDAFGGSEGSVQANMWISVEDSLVRKIVAEGEASLDDLNNTLGLGVLTGRASVEMTIRFFDYGIVVGIEEPVAE